MITLDELGHRARQAGDALALLPAHVKDEALDAGAMALRRAAGAILAANAEDVAGARDAGTSDTLLDRLTLTDSRVASMVDAVNAIRELPDPVGEVTEAWARPNGLHIRRTRVPLGVVAVIYEARPNVTSDIAALCLKSGNAAVLRGSSTALRTNSVIVATLREAFTRAGMPPDALQLMEDTSREAARQLMRLREHIDLLVPRGGPELIADMIENATVPYVIDGAGNCHVYVDAAADLDKALRITVNAKTSRPSVCNAAEKLLVHRDVAAEFLPRVCTALREHDVELRGNEAARDVVDDLLAASSDDWDREYLDLIMAIAVVDTLDDAVAHIRQHATGHTEAIITEDTTAADRFVAECRSAVVMVNASTRFTDGGEMGMGAEVGNSTQRLHARGPMGLRELTTYRLEVRGDGQVRE